MTLDDAALDLAADLAHRADRRALADRRPRLHERAVADAARAAQDRAGRYRDVAADVDRPVLRVEDRARLDPGSRPRVNGASVEKVRSGIDASVVLRPH